MKQFYNLKAAMVGAVCFLTPVLAMAEGAEAPARAAEDYYCVASFTPKSFSNSPKLYLSANLKTTVYIASGNSGSLTSYSVTSEGFWINDMNVLPNSEIKIYVERESLAQQLKGFSLGGIKLKNIDASRLTGVQYFSVSDATLNETMIQMPESDQLVDLSLDNNEFDNYPYYDKYPDLKFLTLPTNRISEFDPTRLPKLEGLNLTNNKLTSIKFDNPELWSVSLAGNQLSEVDLNGLPALQQIFLSNNKLSTLDPSPVLGTVKVIDIVANYFTFATLPLPYDVPINVYYYANQMPMSVDCVDQKVDLSLQAEREGYVTSFYWFLGVPEYDAETGGLYGTLLKEGEDYTIEDGLTTFLTIPSKDVMCVMLNDIAPKLMLYTQLISVASVNSIIDDHKGDNQNVYSIDGRRVGQKEDLKNLPGGIYIVDGKLIAK